MMFTRRFGFIYCRFERVCSVRTRIIRERNNLTVTISGCFWLLSRRFSPLGNCRAIAILFCFGKGCDLIPRLCGSYSIYACLHREHSKPMTNKKPQHTAGTLISRVVVFLTISHLSYTHNAALHRIRKLRQAETIKRELRFARARSARP
jgi:hypothetical protein